MTDSIDVAIVGAGPAGIAAAVALRRRGVRKVVIFEREAQPGGVPRHCGHPPFGMREFGRILTGPAYARRLTELARQMQVDIRTGVSVVALSPGARLDLVSSAGLARVDAHRVILATGVRETPRSARLISGDRPLGVLNTGALQAYVYLHGLAPFKRPVIVGSELVALSALLTCRHAGIRPVAMLEEDSRPNARRPFTLLPGLMGVPLHTRTQLAAIHGGQRVEAVSLRHANGSERELACDGVLLTGRFVPEASLAHASHLQVDLGTSGPRVDQFGRCSDAAFFAAGNLLRPVETAGWSFREGQRIGQAVADDLEGRLPPAADHLELVCGEGIRYVMPQRLALPAPSIGLPELQLRVSRQTRGELILSARDRVLARQRIHSQPDRRILLSLRGLTLPDDAGMLTLALSDSPPPSEPYSP